ncbi:MAG TPA: hypothetical protein VFE31_08540 [Opitutaceae bacterium]|jgi:hypothetical protein|nr:hypothetical protein [Opitutaceae bacterium]
MNAKYSIEYSPAANGHSPPEHMVRFINDPLACEEFLEQLLEEGVIIHTIRRDSAELKRPEFDRMIKVAASAIAADRICASLGIKPEEERFRFGFSA